MNVSIISRGEWLGEMKFSTRYPRLIEFFEKYFKMTTKLNATSHNINFAYKTTLTAISTRMNEFYDFKANNGFFYVNKRISYTYYHPITSDFRRNLRQQILNTISQCFLVIH